MVTGYSVLAVLVYDAIVDRVRAWRRWRRHRIEVSGAGGA
jgi:hypothetical protein